MRRTLDELPAPPQRILDVGCGHGRFAALLQERGSCASYWGIDASAELVALARERSDLIPGAQFARVDVIEDAQAIPAGPFELIGAFAVIHHVPIEAQRAALLRALSARLAPGGTLAVAFWRTTADEDSAKRVPWQSAEPWFLSMNRAFICCRAWSAAMAPKGRRRSLRRSWRATICRSWVG